MPKCPSDKCAEYAAYLGQAMDPYEINTVRRAACFLGQLALESGELRYWEELASGEAYEGRRNLGNTEPGDGPRFKGRGPIQLTGRANYQAFQDATGLAVIDHPEKVATPKVGFYTAVWYWDCKKLNPLADRFAVRSITRIVNGGLTHLDQRKRYTNKAFRILSRTAELR